LGSPETPGTRPGVFTGGERIRTVDPLLAKQVLSQLSYTPVAGKISVPQLQSSCLNPVEKKERHSRRSMCRELGAAVPCERP
jgi:hypothetical protein